MNPAYVESLIVSGTMIGAIIGAALGGRLADRLGRRRLILVGAVVYFAGSLIMAVAPTVEVLILGRFVNVFGQSETFWLYGGLTLLALVFCYQLIPETKGRSPDEIEADLRETAFGTDADRRDAVGSDD